MGSLDGLRVLDVGNLTAGPLTAWLLGSLGADVIKVESPAGDHGRTIKSVSEEADSVGGYYFHSTNSDKRSVVLDLKTDAGAEALLDLVEGADVLVENFRPGTMAGLGFDYPTLRERNDSLIYCSITGYGQDNVGAQKRAYDSILQAYSGIMNATGYADDPPTKIGPSLVDNLGSYVAAVAVIGALCHRDRTGDGQAIDVSMQDCAAWLMQSLLPFEPGRTTHQPAAGPLPLNGVFESKDGWVSLAARKPRAVDRIASAIADADEPRSDDGRLENRLSAWVGGRTVEEIAAELEHIEVYLARIRSLEDVMADPHLDARNTFESIDCQGNELVIPVSPYVTARRDEPRPETGGPELGEHTEAVLAELAGYDEDRIDAVRASVESEPHD